MAENEGATNARQVLVGGGAGIPMLVAAETGVGVERAIWHIFGTFSVHSPPRPTVLLLDICPK